LFGRPRALVGWGTHQPVREGLELRFMALDFPMLPEHDVAQFGNGALEVDNLDLDLFQSLVVQTRLFNVVLPDSDADTVTPAAMYRQERARMERR
jgi:hypothetical protein